MLDRSILLILFCTFISNTIYGLASPFLPTVLELKDVSSVWTGVIFSAYAIASTIVAVLTGLVLDKIGHNKVIMFGAFLMSGSIIAFGFIEDID